MMIHNGTFRGLPSGNLLHSQVIAMENGDIIVTNNEMMYIYINILIKNGSSERI